MAMRWFMVWIFSAAFGGIASAEGIFRAGFAQANVTPQQAMPMWGYGARHALLSRGMRDPLFAKAVVIEAGDSKLALVGLDLGRSLGEPQFTRIREAVKRDSGVDFIMISGSHTHHGPVLELKDVPGQGKEKYDAAVAYVGELELKLIDIINRAASNLQDARIGWNSEQVDMNRNRHAKSDPKPRDTELAVLRVDSLEGKPIAIVVNFAAHPTILEGSDLRWSAEYPGAMMKAVESAIGSPCIFMQGASGDMSAQTRPEDNPASDDPRLAQATSDKAQASLIRSILKLGEQDTQQRQRDIMASGLRMESFGKRLGEQVLSIAQKCETKVPEHPSLQGSYKQFDFASRVDFSNPALRAMFAIAFFPELAEAAAAEQTDNQVHPLLTTVLLNGELALVGGSGEFFSNHSVRLKERAYSTRTLFFGYCNGHHMYLPTIEAVSQGGYGADPEVSWVEIGAGEQMMNQALINIFTMQGKFKRTFLSP